jgi:hypothetical protein
MIAGWRLAIGGLTSGDCGSTDCRVAIRFAFAVDSRPFNQSPIAHPSIVNPPIANPSIVNRLSPIGN